LGVQWTGHALRRSIKMTGHSFDLKESAARRGRREPRQGTAIDCGESSW
jgi:hypothetical protein